MFHMFIIMMYIIIILIIMMCDECIHLVPAYTHHKVNESLGAGKNKTNSNMGINHTSLQVYSNKCGIFLMENDIYIELYCYSP